MSKLKEISELDFTKSWYTSCSVTEFLVKSEACTSSEHNRDLAKELAYEYGLSFDHFKRGNTVRYTDDDVFVLNSPVAQDSLRKRYSRLFPEEECSVCLNKQWLEQKIPLCLDHVNGHSRDNRLENLRWLCPNCHAQTETYCGRNKSLVRNKCIDCDAPIAKLSKRCRVCDGKTRFRPSKIEWPSTKDLKSMLEESNYVQVGKKLGVSDNAIRKHLKNNS